MTLLKNRKVDRPAGKWRRKTITDIERDLQPPKRRNAMRWSKLAKGLAIAAPLAALGVVILNGPSAAQSVGLLAVGIYGAGIVGYAICVSLRGYTRRRVLEERIRQRRDGSKLLEVNAGSGSLGAERGLVQTAPFAPGTIVRMCHFPVASERRGYIEADSYGTRAIAPVQDSFGDEWPARLARAEEGPGYKRAFGSLMDLANAQTIRLEWNEWHDGAGDTSKTCKDWLQERTASAHGGSPGRWNLMLRNCGVAEADSEAGQASGKPEEVHSMAAPIDRVRPAVVRITAILEDARAASGSGVIIDENGIIVTDEHVVRGSVGVMVRFADGTVTEGRVLSTDPDADIALVCVSTRAATVAGVADSKTVQPGDDVLVLGYGSTASEETMEAAALSGHISAVLQSGGFTYIQTDAAVNPGDSGGPLVNGNGEVIGIVVFRREKSEDGRAIQNVGFAIASNDVVRVVKRLYTKRGS